MAHKDPTAYTFLLGQYDKCLGVPEADQTVPVMQAGWVFVQCSRRLVQTHTTEVKG